MARRSSGKPWLHAKSGYWCSTVAGKRVYLDKDYKVACRKLREALAEQKRADQGVASDWLDVPIGNLADEFLDHIQASRKATTHANYRYCLLRALRIVGPKTRVADLGKLHLAKIEQKLTGKYSPSTVRDTIQTLQTVFSWAIKHDLLTENPLAGYQKPAGRSRTRIVTKDEFNKLFGGTDARFRDVLTALRHTGCRPIEVRTLVWDWVDLDEGLWILKDHKTITRQRNPLPRLIPLSDEVLSLCKRLAERRHSATDRVFLNAHGKPYSKNGMCQKMARLRERVGIEPKAGEQLVLYSARHTFGTNANGRVSDIELATLMGHTDVRTTQRYVHINTDRLRDIQRRASTPTHRSTE